MRRPANARTAHLVFAVLVITVAVVAVTAGRRPAALVATATALVVIGRQVAVGLATGPAWRAVLAGVAVLTLDALGSVAVPALTGIPDAASGLSAVALPLGFLGLLAGPLLLVSPPGRRNPGALIDAALVAVTATTVLWAVVLRPQLDRIDATPATVVTSVLTVLLFGGMTGALLRSFLAQGARHAGVGYVLVSATAGLAGNAFKVLATDDAAVGAPWWVAVFWGLAYGGLAAASLHPSGAAVAVPPSAERLTRTRILGLGGALLAAPVIVGLQAGLGSPVDGVLVAANAVVVVPLVLGRVAMLARLYHAAEARLAHLAEHDELTGLANRRAVTSALRETLARVSDGSSPGAVVAFLDLDDFKSVNDGLGHPTGDRLLVAVSERLRGRLRAGDTVARFGGDEFLILCEGDPEAVERRIRETVAAALAEPFELDGTRLTCRASVGTRAVHPGESTPVDEVLSAADAEMYRHKGRPARAT